MNTAMTLAKQPSILPLYMACLLKKAQPRIEEDHIRELTLSFDGCEINQKKLRKFNSFFDISDQSKSVPATFLHLLVFRPQLKFLLNKALPFPVMGLVHLFNDIIVHKSVFIGDKLDIQISVKDFSINKKGKELTLHTKVSKQGQLVWESFSGYLYPNKTKKKPSAKPLVNEFNSNFSQIWQLPSNIGRRFALLSGDANPIHTYKLAANLFGFKQAIVHGMCMALKCGTKISKLRSDQQPIKRLYVEFKKPVFLPNSVKFKLDSLNGESVDFQVTSEGENETCLLKGYCAY